MSLLDRLAPRRSEPVVSSSVAVPAPEDPTFSTKALRKFLRSITASQSPVLIHLRPVLCSNVTFSGEQLGCKIFVEDIFADVERHTREGRADELAAFFKKRFRQASGGVDGILCWDVIDYLPPAAAQELAAQCTRLLRP